MCRVVGVSHHTNLCISLQSRSRLKNLLNTPKMNGSYKETSNFTTIVASNSASAGVDRRPRRPPPAHHIRGYKPSEQPSVKTSRSALLYSCCTRREDRAAGGTRQNNRWWIYWLSFFVLMPSEVQISIDVSSSRICNRNWSRKCLFSIYSVSGL